MKVNVDQLRTLLAEADGQAEVWVCCGDDTTNTEIKSVELKTTKVLKDDGKVSPVNTRLIIVVD